MKDAPQPFMGGFPEHNEPTVQHAEKEAIWDGMTTEQLLMNSLLEAGFAWEEAVKLLHLRESLYDNAEMRQRMAEDYRMHFARWLYEQGELREA